MVQTKDAIKLYVSLPEVDALPAGAIMLETEAEKATLSVAGQDMTVDCVNYQRLPLTDSAR